MKLKKWGWLIAFCLVIASFQVSAAADNKRCSLCGMDLTKYPHSVYTVFWKDGGSEQTCGVQCGLKLQLMKPEQFKKAWATDLITNREFEADKGYYVFKSSVTTDMGPGFIAFNKKENAEKFQKGFGGQVLTHPEALKTWAEFLKNKK